MEYFKNKWFETFDLEKVKSDINKEVMEIYNGDVIYELKQNSNGHLELSFLFDGETLNLKIFPGSEDDEDRS